MATILWSALAREHLREIDRYVSEGSPFYSIVFIDRLIGAVEKVGAFPHIGRIVPEFEREDLREIFFHKYRIVYQFKENTITIVAIVHGAMDLTARREREPWDLV